MFAPFPISFYLASLDSRGHNFEFWLNATALYLTSLNHTKQICKQFFLKIQNLAQIISAGLQTKSLLVLLVSIID